jgi:GNAT superfamily N-acetyltransferase
MRVNVSVNGMPNLGRCSHICNAGFLTCTVARGKGVGKVMGKAYLQIAPQLVCRLLFSRSVQSAQLKTLTLTDFQGYTYSVFNLVFANNPASIKIWDGLGFKVIGRVPKAARLANSETMVDALIYGRDLI